jgi:Phosphotransferase enzyme family
LTAARAVAASGTSRTSTAPDRSALSSACSSTPASVSSVVRANSAGWLVTNRVLPAELVARNRRVAEALRSWAPVFTHGDLQIDHVFVEGDEVTGVLDWSEAAPGDGLYDLATLTLGHTEHLGDVVAGYGSEVDLEVVRGWWSLRSLRGIRWLIEHGFDPYLPGCEIDVLRSQM